MEDFQRPQLLEILRKSLLVSLWLVVGGFPCQPHSALNPKRKHFEDARSQHQEIKRVADELQELVPTALVHLLAENVRMAKWVADTISTDLGVHPIAICPSGRSPSRRLRFYWLTWKLKARAGTRLVHKPIPELHFLPAE